MTLVVATRLMIFQWQQSSANANFMRSHLSHNSSNPSGHQRFLLSLAAILRSCFLLYAFCFTKAIDLV
jgi:hypothetical protein